NINTFLAIAEISDHLQAMLMGRVDIMQNHHYQHLALAERRKSASLVRMQPISPGQVSTRPPLSTSTPLNVVKQTGFMVIPKNMTMENAIRTNLHTFDDRRDITGFIEDAFTEGFFEDIAKAFEEIRDAEGPERATAMVERHAVLYPLKFGSCMREVNLWGCPYRLKCQNGAFCEHFTLTGRIDEFLNIEAKIHASEKAHVKLSRVLDKAPCYNTQLTEIEEGLERLKIMKTKWLHHANSKRVTAFEDILSGDIKTEGDIRTLTQLFALEYQKNKTGGS
ncbi:TPA: hypothetical protein L6J41_003658, partial [Escherichia coli]|nr:hypothetical protein [Escherichia coli]